MRRTWIRLLLFLALLAGVLALGILLTPTVHDLVRSWGYERPTLFVKVLRRMLLVPALLLVFAALKPWRDGGPASYGLLGPRARLRPGLLAFGTTTLVALAILGGHAVAGWLRWEDPFLWGRALGRTGRWILSALPLALLEEWFFRGWLDRRLGRRLAPLGSALAVAGIFALIHAFRPSRLDVEVTHDVDGALTAVGAWLSNLVDVASFGPTFVGLFLLSLLLTALYRRTGTLWTPIGAHAAGIWVLRSYGAWTVRHPERTWAGTKELYDGWPVQVLLLVLVVALWPRRTPSRAPPGPSPQAP